MLALAKALRSIWPGEIDVVFLNRALTQNWDFDSADFQHEVLPIGWRNAARAMQERIQRTQPALLHVAGWSAAPSLVALLSGHARGLPVVVDLDTWRGTPSRWRGAVKQLVYPKLFSRVTHFAPGGSRQADYLRGYGVPDEKITPIEMTVDVASIRRFLAIEPNAGKRFRERFGIAAGVPVVLFIGRLVSRKGIVDLLEAWPSVTSRMPEMKLVIAGDGAEREMVAAAAAQDPSIHPVGRLSGNEVWSAYSTADLVVAPSHFEPWGLVANEAMAAGTPIILTDIFGCVGDLAQDGETALVIPAQSPAQLAEAILRLASDSSLRERLANSAAKLISRWTIESEAEKIKGIWMRALAMRKGDEVFVPTTAS
jgi:glycosyltransferase involved in cell wall biosynthesis